MAGQLQVPLNPSRIVLALGKMGSHACKMASQSVAEAIVSLRPGRGMPIQ